MKAALEADLEDDAHTIFDRLWGAHKECASRWRGATDYPCTMGWCQFGPETLQLSADMDRVVEDIGDLKFVHIAKTDAHRALRMAALEESCDLVVAEFAKSRFFDPWALGKCAESAEMGDHGRDGDHEAQAEGTALRYLAGMFSAEAATKFKKEIGGVAADQVQGHSSAGGVGSVGEVLVDAMRAACMGGDEESAEAIFDKLVAAHAECKGRWRGAANYPCERKWCDNTEELQCSPDMAEEAFQLDAAELEEAKAGASERLVEVRMAALNRRCDAVVRFPAWTDALLSGTARMPLLSSLFGRQHSVNCCGSDANVPLHALLWPICCPLSQLRRMCDTGRQRDCRFSRNY